MFVVLVSIYFRLVIVPAFALAVFIRRLFGNRIDEGGGSPRFDLDHAGHWRCLHGWALFRRGDHPAVKIPNVPRPAMGQNSLQTWCQAPCGTRNQPLQLSDALIPVPFKAFA
jgi:hypothetical protein